MKSKRVRIKKQTVLFLTDFHLPYYNEKTFDLVINYALKDYKIDHVILGGDLIDCFKISRFPRDPFDKLPLHDEIEFVKDWLIDLREIFPKQKITYIKGNHERRFETYLHTKAPQLARIQGLSIEEQLELKQRRIKYIDNNEKLINGEPPFSIGELFFLHGDEIPGGGVSCTRSKYLKVQNNIAFGHHHTVQQYTHKRFTSIYSAWAVGCMCTTHPEYCPVNQHINGFAIISFSSNGTFKFENKMIIDNKIL